MVEKITGTKKNKSITFRTDEKTEKVLDVMASAKLDNVPNNSRGQMITMMVKSIANQVLEGKSTFLCRDKKLKKVLNQHGFDEKTFTLVTDNDEFKDFAEFEDVIKQAKQTLMYFDKEVVEQEKRSEELNRMIGEKEKQLKELEETYNTKLNDYRIEKPQFKGANQKTKHIQKADEQHGKTQTDNAKPVVEEKEVKPKQKLPSVEEIRFHDVNGNEGNELYLKDFDKNYLTLKDFESILGEEEQVDSKNGKILLSNRTIAKVREIVTDNFDGYLNDKTFNEVAEDIIERQDEIGNSYSFGIETKEAKERKKYAYPNGIGQYMVYFTDGNGNDFYEIRYNKYPVNRVNMALIDELIDFEVEMSKTKPYSNDGNESFEYGVSNLTNYEENLASVKQSYEEDKPFALVINIFYKE